MMNRVKKEERLALVKIRLDFCSERTAFLALLVRKGFQEARIRRHLRPYRAADWQPVQEGPRPSRRLFPFSPRPPLCPQP